ncbi:MAG: ASKHA domain-containing protein [Dehalococcoidales bacterium]
MANYTIDFQPMGRKGKCRDGESILECARRLDIDISGVCGGRGTCHTCRVQVTGGTLSEPTSHENEALSEKEFNDCWRLACQASPRSNCQVTVPLESMSASQRVYLEGNEMTITPEPAVRTYHLKLTPPTLSDQLADADRLLAALGTQHKVTCNNIDLAVLRSLSPLLRSWDWECQVSVRDDEIIAVAPWPSRQLGLAVDLGTTTIASYLMDLTDGRTLASLGAVNPQVSYGEDIISRVDHIIKSPQDGIRQQKLVTDKIGELARDLCKQTKTSVDNIVEAVIVCNTAMHHILLNLSVRQLVMAPFTAAASMPMDIKARDLGIKLAPGANVHIPPVITGFIGSDHLAMLLATGRRKADDLVVALDIGTNTEISLLVGDEITTTSCASGPAFEGGHIKHGIRAAEGAIERLRITDDAIDYQTINNAPPIGICGSGIMDGLAQLYLAKIIDAGGRFVKDHPRVRITDNQAEFVIVDQEREDGRFSIVITQKDIRELQLAKAAIRAGIKLLLETRGHTEEQINQVIIAGSFGTYIDLSSAVTIGLLPDLPLESFSQVGNAAGMGAKQNLISQARRLETQNIASRIHYVELASSVAFRQTFIEACKLGQYRLQNSKTEVVK